MTWQKGQSGNPRGRPMHSRQKLSEQLIKYLQRDFEQSGIMAIEKVRKTDPASYLRIIASLVPKEITADVNLDADLAEALRADPRELARRTALILHRADLAMIETEGSA